MHDLNALPQKLWFRCKRRINDDYADTIPVLMRLGDYAAIDFSNIWAWLA
jgi:hypothetical protein